MCSSADNSIIKFKQNQGCILGLGRKIVAPVPEFRTKTRRDRAAGGSAQKISASKIAYT